MNKLYFFLLLTLTSCPQNLLSMNNDKEEPKYFKFVDGDLDDSAYSPDTQARLNALAKEKKNNDVDEESDFENLLIAELENSTPQQFKNRTYKTDKIDSAHVKNKIAHIIKLEPVSAEETQSDPNETDSEVDLTLSTDDEQDNKSSY